MRQTPSDNLLRDFAMMDPAIGLITATDEELASIARHLLPDIAGELLAYRLAARLSDATPKSRYLRRILPAWIRAGRLPIPRPARTPN